jgi:hypothetical protein
MRSRAFLGELVVPAIVLIGTFLFWWSIREAPSISRRVPLGVIAFILFLTGVVAVREAIVARGDEAAPAPPFGETVQAWFTEWRQRIAFIALAIGYYFAFVTLGFSAANLLFLVAALVVAGSARGREPVAAAWRIALIAIVATVVFHLLAEVMDFNVPRGPFGF